MDIIRKLIRDHNLFDDEGRGCKSREECETFRSSGIAGENSNILLENVIADYLEKELDYRFEPHSAFLYGRKIQKNLGLDIEKIEELVNTELPEKIVEYEKEIKVNLQDDMFDSFLGYFVSGLYHDVLKENETITFDLRSFPPKFPHLRYRIGNKWGFGYRHIRGELRIIGYSGGYLGHEMRGGVIDVVGRVSDRTGYRMRDGIIRVHGSCGWRTGDEMIGGRIVIDGDSGEWTGINMYGGEIRVRGKIKSVGRRYGGRIYCWDDRWVEIG
jgi:formylmethanofuran dehydrogenase subunit C